MKKTILFVCLLVLSACAHRPTFKREYLPVGSTGFGYENKDVKFEYSPVSFGTSLPIKVKNRADRPIKIIWDETSFVDGSGQPNKVVVSGTRLIERNSSILPTVIPPGVEFVDSLTPASLIDWGGRSWEYKAICRDPGNDFEADESCVGKVFSLFVTYEVDGRKKTFEGKYKYVKRTVLVPGTGRFSVYNKDIEIPLDKP